MRKGAKYDLDINFFNIIDSEEKAYFLGWLYSDGSVSKNGYQVTLALSCVDKEILEQFKKSISYEGPLLFSKSKSASRDRWRLILSSKQLVESLAEKNCVNNKTKIVTFPSVEIVPKHLQRHFLRGVFDGDGCIYLNKKRNDTKASIVSASWDFVKGIQDLTLEIDIRSSIKSYNTYYVLTYSGNNSAYKFLHWIYDESNFFLKRKKAYLAESEKYIQMKVKRHLRRRPVLQYDKNMNFMNEYESSVHAQRITGIKYQNIRLCCDLTQRTAGGYYWRWKQ